MLNSGVGWVSTQEPLALIDIVCPMFRARWRGCATGSHIKGFTPT